MPDLIIYMGKSLISKNLKTFLRNAQTPLWQVGNGTTFADPLQSMRINIGVDEIGFLETVQALTAQKATFLENWLKEDLTISRRIFKEALPFSEVAVFREVMEALPDEIDLHLANSMPVRYANFFQTKNDSIRVFSNRGTSGIDGTNSTAVGNALVTQRKVVLLTGDLSFLYDRNAFFHDYDISNLYVIVFNNFGGGIFDLIPGPVSLPEDERETHFTTPHGKDMKKTADDAGFAYFKANDEITLELALASFFEAGNKARLLEIQTNSKINQQTFKQFKALAL